MPELPEVETVKRSLEPHIINQQVIGVDVSYEGIIKEPNSEEFKDLLLSKTFINIKRRGKYLLLGLSDNYTLVIHLRMTGRLIICNTEEVLDKHTHLIINLSSKQQLRFIDVRKFGMIYLVPTGSWENIKGLYSLGVEPLSDEFILDKFVDMIKSKKSKLNLKSFLLSQSDVAGIGNIYADEILFDTGLHPEKSVSEISVEQIEKLYHSIRLKLEEGIKYRGTSFRDYVDGFGEKGDYQNRLQVYGRQNQECLKCGSDLKRIHVAGRGTVYCPKCQS